MINAVASVWSFYCTTICSDSPFWVGFVSVNGLAAVEFLILITIFLLLDVYKWPNWLYKYKINKTVEIDLAKYWAAQTRILFNVTVVQVPTTLLLVKLMNWRGAGDNFRELPGLLEITFHLSIAYIWWEIGTYLGHRLLHHPLLFKHIHSIHHEWLHPVGGTGLYVHPAEYLILIMQATWGGLILVGAHWFTATIWLIAVLFEGVHEHCGYHLPFSGSPQFHYFHHTHPNSCYGSKGWMDEWFDTLGRFKGSKEERRNRILFSFTPIDELIH